MVAKQPRPLSRMVVAGVPHDGIKHRCTADDRRDARIELSMNITKDNLAMLVATVIKLTVADKVVFDPLQRMDISMPAKLTTSRRNR